MWLAAWPRGNKRRAIYLSDADRRRFCQLLEQKHDRFANPPKRVCQMLSVQM
jgi:hypothetical protein